MLYLLLMQLPTMAHENYAYAVISHDGADHFHLATCTKLLSMKMQLMVVLNGI